MALVYIKSAMLSIALALILLNPITAPAPIPGPLPAPSPPLNATRDPTSTREKIQAALDAMAKAVLAGDVAAYAACVYPRSPFFVIEQTEWAKDLLKAETRPVKFAATVVGEGTVTQAKTADGTVIETWVGGVKFEWTMPTTGEAKNTADASVECEVAFMRPALEEGWALGWRYAGEAMETLDTDTKETHATIHYPKGAKVPGQQIAKAFPVAKAHVDAFFGKAIDRVEEIRLFDRRDVLQMSVYPSMFQTDTTLSGWSETGQSIKFVTWYARDEKGWTAAYAHEYAHVATWNLGDKAAATPWWLQEGIAELAAETFTGGRARIDPIIVAWAKKNELAAWDEIADYRKTPQTKRRHPYHQGHHMVGFVHDTKGRETCIKWITVMANGKGFDEATHEVLGMSFADLDAAWRAHVAGLVTKSEAKDKNQPTPSEKR